MVNIFLSLLNTKAAMYIRDSSWCYIATCILGVWFVSALKISVCAELVKVWMVYVVSTSIVYSKGKEKKIKHQWLNLWLKKECERKKMCISGSVLVNFYLGNLQKNSCACTETVLTRKGYTDRLMGGYPMPQRWAWYVL